jgi:hypothetical protein
MKKQCPDATVEEALVDAEVEVLVADIVWEQTENVFAQTVVTRNLIREVFPVIL